MTNKMAARKTHDLAVVVSEYKDNQGQDKKRYQNVGALMQGDKGPFIMLAKWFNPAGVQDSRGGESLLISAFEPRQVNTENRPQSGSGANQPAATSAGGYDDFNDDVPFTSLNWQIKNHLI